MIIAKNVAENGAVASDWPIHSQARLRYDNRRWRLRLRSARWEPSTLAAERTDQNHTASPIRAVILDYGDVISQPPDPASITAMAAMFNLPEDRFRDHYSALRHAYDRGDLHAHEYWAGIARAAGVELRASQVERLRETDVACGAA